MPDVASDVDNLATSEGGVADPVAGRADGPTGVDEAVAFEDEPTIAAVVEEESTLEGIVVADGAAVDPGAVASVFSSPPVPGVFPVIDFAPGLE